MELLEYLLNLGAAFIIFFISIKSLALILLAFCGSYLFFSRHKQLDCKFIQISDLAFLITFVIACSSVIFDLNALSSPEDMHANFYKGVNFGLQLVIMPAFISIVARIITYKNV